MENSEQFAERAREYTSLENHPLFRQEVEELLRNEKSEELSDRFYRELDFGTGGIRGKIGGGFNRINPYMIRKATRGLASYILKEKGEGSSVVIAYDSRRYSDLFAMEAALTLCAAGIHVYLFTSLRPTPELSYAVRRLGATAGIVITASHNPPAYNGYKVYWEDGGQIVPPHDSGIIAEVRQVSGSIEAVTEGEALAAGLLHKIDREIDDPYNDMIKGLSLNPDLFSSMGDECTIVYTPLHGTGCKPVVRVLKEMGLDVVTVPEQAEPDGEFPTVEYPNPEEASALRLAIELGKRKNADLVMATDPDADRLGIAVPDGDEFRLISGNQLGTLLCDYIFSQLKEKGTLPVKPVLVKTIVTTELQALVAGSYGASTVNVLTGFKYIAEQIKKIETAGETYIFGGEESYGYLVGTEVRDKDAVSAAFVTVEMTLFHRSRGKSILDRLNEIYREFGFFQEILISRSFEGASGAEKIRNMMKSLREERPETFGGSRIVKVRDYQTGTVMDVVTGHEEPTGLPESNVLQFITDDDSIISARPSGTEPKIKFYASCRSNPAEDPDLSRKEVAEKIGKIREDIEALFH